MRGALLTPIRLLTRAAELFGTRPAILTDTQRFTYGEFARRCGRLAMGLRERGVRAGDPVAFLGRNSHQMLEAYFGIPMSGAAFMPLNVRWTPAELATVVNHAEVPLLFYESEFAPLIEHFRACCPSVRDYVTLEGDYENLIGTGSADSDRSLEDEDAVAGLFYTSGTTGSPQGVMLTHKGMYLHALGVAHTYADPETTVDLHAIPLFHANGWGRVHADVLLGIPQVVAGRFQPARALRTIERHRVTDVGLVPSMAAALLEEHESGGNDVSSLREIQIGGAACTPDLIRRMEQAFGCHAWAGYGLTEAGPMVSCARTPPSRVFASDEERWEAQARAGRPIPGVEMRILDSAGSPVPRDGTTAGEIVLRCDGMMAGYYRDPEGTAAALHQGWLYTGDAAVWYEDGSAEIIDRMKDLVISGGENISPVQVEQAILAHPAVAECAVVAAPDDVWGEVPAAIIVPRDEAEVSVEELAQFLEGSLSRFQIPKRFEFVYDPLPRTATGKVRKMLLREWFWKDRTRRVGE